MNQKEYVNIFGNTIKKITENLSKEEVAEIKQIAIKIATEVNNKTKTFEKAIEKLYKCDINDQKCLNKNIAILIYLPTNICYNDNLQTKYNFISDYKNKYSNINKKNNDSDVLHIDENDYASDDDDDDEIDVGSVKSNKSIKSIKSNKSNKKISKKNSINNEELSNEDEEIDDYNIDEIDEEEDDDDKIYESLFNNVTKNLYANFDLSKILSTMSSYIPANDLVSCLKGSLTSNENEVNNLIMSLKDIENNLIQNKNIDLKIKQFQTENENKNKSNKLKDEDEDESKKISKKSQKNKKSNNFGKSDIYGLTLVPNYDTYSYQNITENPTLPKLNTKC